MLLALALLPAPARAGAWSTDFNMGSFLAYAGDETSGSIGLECGSREAGAPVANTLFLTVHPRAAFALDPHSMPEGIRFVVDDRSLVLPMQLAVDGRALEMDREMAALDLQLQLLAALMEGRRLAITSSAGELAVISLAGSADALAAIAACTGGDA